MTPRAALSDHADRQDRDDRQRLRTLEGRFETLLERRRTLLTEFRRISGEQRELYDRRQEPQAEAAELHRKQSELGRRLLELRAERDAARRRVEEAVIRRRELLLTFERGESERPEQIRREIAQLELQQQTRALPLEEENTLIARLRRRTADLKEAEGRGQVVAEHATQRKEADLAVANARAEVERLGQAMLAARGERDAAIGGIRGRLEAAGGMLAELRAKGKARAELMAEIDAVSKELDQVDAEGRELLARTRARRAEAARTVRQYSGRHRPPEEALASIAEAHLEELMKRGKVSL